MNDVIKEVIKIKILAIGISTKDGKKPFDITTLSGKYIKMVEEKCNNIFVKTNLCDFHIKEKYPNKDEIKIGINNIMQLYEKLNPDKVILFGIIVQNALKDKIENVICATHPSYVMVYRKKEISKYVEKLAKEILK